MNSFKEWLSDYLRYFILALAMVLAVLIIIVGVRIYQNVYSPDQQQGDPSAVEILTETTSAKSTENGTAEHTEKNEDDAALDQKDAETTGENVQTEIEADTATDVTEEEETEKVIVITKEDVTESNPSGNDSSETITPESVMPETKGSEAVSAQTEQAQTDLPQTVASQTEPPHTEPPQTELPQTEPPQTEPPHTEPPEPVYMTVISACNFRSYADYGDNVIAWYPAGTVVEFLEDVGGWYKVQIDGMVGYMGAKFLQ